MYVELPALLMINLTVSRPAAAYDVRCSRKGGGAGQMQQSVKTPRPRIGRGNSYNGCGKNLKLGFRIFRGLRARWG